MRKRDKGTSRKTEEVECWRCGYMLSRGAGQGQRLKCLRCGALTLEPDGGETLELSEAAGKNRRDRAQ